MKIYKTSRREFLGSASLAAMFLLGCRDTEEVSASGGLLEKLRRNTQSCEGCGAGDFPSTVSSKMRLDPPGGPGVPLIVSGTVYRPGGREPAPNTLIYAYHTDVRGRYGRPGEHRHGRYRGWMLTDDRGRYEITTIMPASYPDSTIAAHIHMTVTTLEMKEDWIDSVVFEGDKFLTSTDRSIRKGGFDPVLRLTTDRSGVYQGVRDIALWI